MSQAHRQLDPRDLPELEKARGLWSRNRFREAMRSFEKIARKHPNNLHALADAGRAFGQRLELDQANAFLDRLEKISKGNARGLLMCGQSHHMLKQPADAIRCLEAALKLAPGEPEIALELAVILERTHQLDRMSVLLEPLMASQSSQPEVALVRARLAMREKDWTLAESLLLKLAQGSALLTIRTEAYARLAQVRDRQERYAEAYECMMARAALLEPHAGPARERADFEEHHMSGLGKSLEASHLNAWLDSAADGPVLFTGPARSGTTLMMRMLDAHPSVATADEREILSAIVVPGVLEKVQPSPETLHASDLESLSATIPDRLGRFYRKRLGMCAGAGDDHKVIIDKSPSLGPTAPIFMLCNPGGKIIHAIRDPRDVLLSSIFRDLPLNSVSVRFLDLESAARRLVYELESWLHLREILPSNRWAEIRFEELIESPDRALQGVMSCLGLTAASEMADYRSTPNTKWVNSPTYVEVEGPLSKRPVGRWRNYEKELAVALPILRPVCDKLGYA